MTYLKEHIEFLQFIDTKGSLCDDGPDLKHGNINKINLQKKLEKRVPECLMTCVFQFQYLHKRAGRSLYHVAFSGVFDGLDDPQSLFKTHLLDHICTDGTKFLPKEGEQKPKLDVDL